jgi:hypothetical protein
VLLPTGLAAFAEPDWDTLAIDHPDPRLASRYREYVVEQVVRNSRIGRALPAMAERPGLTVRRVLPMTTVFRDAGEADGVLGLLRVSRRAVDDGWFTEVDAHAWVDHIRSGPFFAAVSMFVTVAAV